MGFISQGAGIVPGLGSGLGQGFGSIMGGVGSGVASGAPQMQNQQRGYYDPTVQKYQNEASDPAFMDALKNQMYGTGPSAADVFQRNASGQAAANANAIAASTRGDVNPALAMRTAQNAAAAGGAQANAQAAQMKAQEAQSAIGEFGQVRGQDLNYAGALQGLGMQGDLGQTKVTNEFAGAGMQTMGQMAAAGAKAGSYSGGVIPGRAPFPGDSPHNDIVMRKVSPGEVVLPRSVTTAPDAPERAMEFMSTMKHHDFSNGGFGAVIDLHERLKRLEAKSGKRSR